jgi:hypothetical protein
LLFSCHSSLSTRYEVYLRLGKPSYTVATTIANVLGKRLH